MSTAPRDAVAIRSAVRRNAIWAAGAAIIMLYYGFYKGLGAEPPIEWPARLKAGSALSLYTLQTGGVLMVLSTVLSLAGIRPALLFDALASVGIGFGLAMAGLLRFSGSAWEPILLLLFGALFVHSGYRNWREYDALSALAVPDEPSEPVERTADSATAAADATGSGTKKVVGAAAEEAGNGREPGPVTSSSQKPDQTE